MTGGRSTVRPARAFQPRRGDPVLTRRRAQAAMVLIMVLSISVAVLGDIPNLAGRWVMLQVYPQIAVLPLAGEVNQSSYVIQQVEIEQHGGMLTMLDSYCFTYVDSGTPLVSTEIPAAFMAALRPTPRIATVMEQDDEILFAQEPYIEIRGAVLENPETDELPEGPDDPRVVDQDGDGNPGMTVSAKIFGINAGETYVVQRVRYVLTGTVISLDRIEGTIEWSDEQSILDVSNPILRAGASSSPDPDPAKHVFVMIRAQEGWTCEWLAAHWRELFGVE